MDEAILARQLQYLDNASDLLLASAPVIAAHLRTQWSSRAEAADANALPMIRHGLCPTCGHFIRSKLRCQVPSSRKKNASDLHRTRQDRLAGRSVPTGTILECLKCKSAMPAPVRGQQTRRKDISLNVSVANNPKLAPEVKKSTSRSVKGLEAAAIPVSDTLDKPASAPAKKRSRDKKSSLRALLADRNRTEAARPKGFGLSLTDFTK